jgi:transposase
MYVQEIIKKRGAKKYRTVLIRESYREGKSVKNRTIANISKLPDDHIEKIKKILKTNGVDMGSSNSSFDKVQIFGSKEYGASKVIIDIAKDLGLDKIIYSKKVKWSLNALAMIVGRIIYPGSKLALTNMYQDTVLWELCGHKTGSKPDVNKDCYLSMDKLFERQKPIQKQLAKNHLRDGCIVLYDITSSYFEGEYEDSDLVKYGYNRDCKRGHQQVNIGLLTNREGCPIAIETFAGNTQDQVTVKGEVDKLVNDYKVKEVIFVGDRGMLTPKRVEEVNKEGYKTITALTRSQMQNLISTGVIKTTQFKINDYPEVHDPENPEIRYILCLNPKRQKNDSQTRMSLINATVAELEKIKNSKIKRCKEKIGARVGKIWVKYGTEKYFRWSVERDELEYSINQELVDKEKRIDGCYVIRADVTSKILSSTDIYKTYKKLINVEQAFRVIKTTSLEIRPVFHHLDSRIQAHVFLCMLSYYLQWHMNQRLSRVYQKNGEGQHRRWTFQQVIERLKAIRCQKVQLGDINLQDVITTPDSEQRMLLEALSINL